MECRGQVASIWAHPGSPWIVWPALTIAFSPVLVELAQHLIAHPWARSALVFPWLAAVAIRADRQRTDQRPESKRLIWICVGIALCLELVAVAGGLLRLGRVAFVLAGVGIVWGAGWARPASALLLVWLLPFPSTLSKLASPGLEIAWGHLVAGLVPGLQLDSGATGPSIFVAGESALRLTAHDSGLVLAFGLAGLGWFRAAVAGHELGQALRTALQWAGAMLPIQLILLTLGGGALAAGAEGTHVRWLLDQSSVLVIAVSGLALALQRWPASGHAAPGALGC